MKEKREKKTKGKTLNSSINCTGMVSPKIDFVERAELNKLTSANLYKLLQLKKVQNRSKLAKKEERVNALVGIVIKDDFLSLGYSVKERNRPEEMSAKPEKGKRFNVPVGGLDVHKVTLVVSIADRTGIKDRRNFLNAENGIEDLIHFFRYHNVEHAALELTAEYWLKSFWMLSKAGIKVLVANPLQTKTTQGLKTDKEDADRIAITFRDGRLKPSVVCTPDQYSMRKLSRAAFKKTQQSTRAINRFNVMLETFDAADWIKDLHVSRRGVRIFYRTLQLTDKEEILDVLTEEYSKGPHQIRSKNILEERAVDLSKFFNNMDISSNNRILFGEHLEDYVNCKRMAASYRLKLIEFGTKRGLFKEQFKKNLELLLTAPNVDVNTALTILVEHVEISFFWNAKAMARWSGFAPSVKQSGYRKRRNGKIYKGGNKWLRTAV